MKLCAWIIGQFVLFPYIFLFLFNIINYVNKLKKNNFLLRITNVIGVD